MNFKISGEDVLDKFIGPPLIESMKKYAGMTDDEAKEALRLYRVYYEKAGMFENDLYPGIEELIKNLYDSDMKIALATSKPEKYAKMILSHYGLAQYFEGIYGATMDENRVEKPEIIKYALDSMNVKSQDIKDIVMIGDRMHDIYGAKINNISSIGVLYGYGDRDELEKAGADNIVDNVSQIWSVIRGN